LGRGGIRRSLLLTSDFRLLTSGYVVSLKEFSRISPEGRVRQALLEVQSRGEQMSIAMDYPRSASQVSAPEQRFGLAHGEKISNLDEDIRALQQVAAKARFGRGETIFNEGDEAKFAYKVVSGAVRLCKHMADGRRQ